MMPMHFYPRPPGGGRQVDPTASGTANIISIHALRVEGDFFSFRLAVALKISIHALRVEGDFHPSPNGHLL